MALVSRNLGFNTGREQLQSPQLKALHFCGVAPILSPKFGRQETHEEAQDTYNPNTFREEHGDYEYGKIYSLNDELSRGQQICTEMIQWYQQKTRFNEDKFWGDVGKAVSSGCPYPDHGKLSCSEYTLIGIHKLGVVKGIWAGTKRLMRCFAPPLNTWMAKNVDDPVFNLKPQ